MPGSPVGSYMLTHPLPLWHSAAAAGMAVVPGTVAGLERPPRVDAETAAVLAFAEKASRGLLGPDQEYWLAQADAQRDRLYAVLDAAIARRDVATAAPLVDALWRYWALR